MIIGIVYKYTSPSNKVYIGQTVNEYERKHAFLTREKYAGYKIDNARKKYGPRNFKYEILEKHEYSSIEEASQALNVLETYYIGLYNSFKKGYNMSLGGEGSPGYHLTPEQVEKCRIRMLTDNPFKGRRHTEETKKLIQEANSKPVIKLDPLTDEELAEYSSALEAGKSFGKPRANSEIVKVCRGYVSPSGRHYRTALGYKWKYKESSTTISKESTLQADGNGNGEPYNNIGEDIVSTL
jgi:group I intron endonuclease|nr:MAG TPA: intron associated endonuclease [Bacteriophage sp.]